LQEIQIGLVTSLSHTHDFLLVHIKLEKHLKIRLKCYQLQGDFIHSKIEHKIIIKIRELKNSQKIKMQIKNLIYKTKVDQLNM